jgi:hypothetical protein
MTAPEQAAAVRAEAQAGAAVMLAAQGLRLDELSPAEALELGISAGSSATLAWVQRQFNGDEPLA